MLRRLFRTESSVGTFSLVRSPGPLSWLKDPMHSRVTRESIAVFRPTSA